MLEHNFPGVDVMYYEDSGQAGTGVATKRGRWNI